MCYRLQGCYTFKKSRLKVVYALQSAETVYPSQKSNQENSPPKQNQQISQSPAEGKQQALEKNARVTAWVDTSGWLGAMEQELSSANV